MNSKYKLTYFEVSGVAEPIRFLLSYGGIDFEDFEFDSEIWPKLKKEMPFGKVPVLEVNGKQAHQSIAIARYLAKTVKLTGANDWEDLEIDAIVDTISDFKGKLSEYYHQHHQEAKEEYKVLLFGEIVPFYLERFETIVQQNNGHFALGKLIWADFYFVAMLQFFNFLAGKDLFVDCPNLQKVERYVLNLPGIRAYIKRRPQKLF